MSELEPLIQQHKNLAGVVCEHESVVPVIRAAAVICFTLGSLSCGLARRASSPNPESSSSCSGSFCRVEAKSTKKGSQLGFF